MTEMDVMRAMVRAKIKRVGAYHKTTDPHVIGTCKHDVHDFPNSTHTVAWRPEIGWSGCAQCIITCSDILEDPDMPTECEALALRAAHPAWVWVPLAAAAGSGFALGALLL